MNHEPIHAAMRELSAFPGVVGCAVVDAATGMSWYHAGVLPQLERFGEAAVEFWRVQVRLGSYFAELGPPQSAAFSFSDSVVALFPCCTDPALVLVCVTNRKDVQWGLWAQPVASLKQHLAQIAKADRM